MDLHNRSSTRTIACGPRTRLRVENRNGRIFIRVHDRPEAIININADIFAGSGREADSELTRIENAIASTPETIDIITPDLPRPDFMFFGRGSRVDYEILVPRTTEVNIVSRNGRAEVRGVEGPVNVRNRNGAVTIEDTAGNVRVEATNGRVTIERSGASVNVGTTNGPVTIDGAAGDVTAETRNGPVEIRDAQKSVKAATTNGPIRLAGPVNANFDLSASNGSVRLLVPAAARFEIDAESHHGPVRSELPVRDSSGEGPRPRVRIRTTNGGIRISEL